MVALPAQEDRLTSERRGAGRDAPAPSLPARRRRPAPREVAVTLVWQEPLTALSAGGSRDELSERLRAAESAALAAPTGFAAGRGTAGPPCWHAATGARRRRATRWAGSRSRTGPELRVRAGVSGESLKKGPGHYSRTALPGERGTVGIAGHRTTYLAPFRHIDELRARRRDRYPDAVRPLPLPRRGLDRRLAHEHGRRCAASRYGRLALTTCTPPFSAAKRLIVTARLRSSRLF